MAKAYLTRTEPEFPAITLELTGEEARIVQAVIGNIAGGGKGWKITNKIYRELRKVTHSFSNIEFTSSVTKFGGSYE